MNSYITWSSGKPNRFQITCCNGSLDSFNLCGATESHVWQKRDVWGRPVAHVVAFPQWGSWLLVAQNGSEWKICVLSRINSIIYFKKLWAHLSTTLFLPPVFFQRNNAVLKATGEPQESHGPKSHITFLPHVYGRRYRHGSIFDSRLAARHHVGRPGSACSSSYIARRGIGSFWYIFSYIYRLSM